MTVTIRNLKIKTPLALAPMVGLSHSAFRSLLLELGGTGLYFTEMLSAKRLPSENESISPFLIRTREERPLFYQIFVSPDSELEAVIERLEDLDAQGIDINLGCPAPQLRKMRAGLELFKDHSVTGSILTSLRQLTNLPLSVKIRLGPTPDSMRLMDICALLEDKGVDLITIHARCDHEKFCRKPRWEILAPVTKSLSIPVLANGGIFSVEDARRCHEISGAAGLMIGRGGVCKPWLFRDIAVTIFHARPEKEHWPEHEVYLRFIVLLEERFKPEKQLGRLKQFTHYFASNFAFGHILSTRIQNSSTMREATTIAHDFFSEHATTQARGGRIDD